jgi:hypothetical protein
MQVLTSRYDVDCDTPGRCSARNSDKAGTAPLFLSSCNAWWEQQPSERIKHTTKIKVDSSYDTTIPNRNGTTRKGVL